MPRRRRSVVAGTVRPDYLRRLGDDVDAGLALIVDDLVATGALDVHDGWLVVRSRAEWHLASQREAGLDVTAHGTAIWVAEAVQEDLIEGFGPRPPMITWPPCPDHPRHPLWLRGVRADTGRPSPDEAWTCLTTDRVVAELGRL